MFIFLLLVGFFDLPYWINLDKIEIESYYQRPEQCELLPLLVAWLIMLIFRVILCQQQSMMYLPFYQRGSLSRYVFVALFSSLANPVLNFKDYWSTQMSLKTLIRIFWNFKGLYACQESNAVGDYNSSEYDSREYESNRSLIPCVDISGKVITPYLLGLWSYINQLNSSN